jgi:uncharacterized protein YdhG (YjbR/CyaY superfamily)
MSASKDSSHSYPPVIADYLAGCSMEHRALFDRLHGLLLQQQPDAEMTLAYKMPTYAANGHRMHLAVWKHGVSIYGWNKADDGGFVLRHPALQNSTGTLRIPLNVADAITDSEFTDLFRGTFNP